MTSDAPEKPKEEEFKPVLSRPWSEVNLQISCSPLPAPAPGHCSYPLLLPPAPTPFQDNGSLLNKIPVLPSLAHDLLGWKNWKVKFTCKQ